MRVSFLRWSTFLFAGIGLVDSIYLTWTKLANQSVFCGEYGGCDQVKNSPYSEIGGIPVALLGVGAFLAIIVLAALEGKSSFWRNNSPLLVFGISLAGTLYSAYLTYLEIAVIRAICFYCVVSAVMILLLLFVSVTRMFLDQAEAKTI